MIFYVGTLGETLMPKTHGKYKSIINIQALIDERACFEMVRKLRWPNGIRCPFCEADMINKNGHDTTQTYRQRYQCQGCHRYFDDLTQTIFEGHHQPLKVWMVCLYFMGLNLSNQQIANELGLNTDDIQRMTHQLREGIVQKKPQVELHGAVECDEVYIVAGHKGQPEEVRKKTEKGDGIV